MTSRADLFNQARSAHQAGDPRRAEPLYRQFLQGAPAHVAAWYLLGVASQALGKADQAEDCLRTAVQLDPGHAEAHNHLGIVRAQRGKYDEAVASFRRSIRVDPNQADVANNLGLILGKLGELDEAVAWCRRALALRPDFSEAVVNLGFARLEQGRIVESSACYREAIRRNPGSSAIHSGYLFGLNYDPEIDAATLFDEHRRWASIHGRVGGPGASFDPGLVRDPDRPLRIGYVSPNLRTHPVASFLEPILANHTREGFEATCYAEVAAPDAVTMRLQSLAHAWRTTLGLTDEQVADLVRRDRIDILVDLAGHTASNRLGVFTRRPAPVQVTYLGYPNTTGLPAIDYLLTDETTDPTGSAPWSVERLYRLPDGFCCFSPTTRVPEAGPPPALARTSVTFGSLHKLPKLNTRVLDLWAALLQAVPSGRLLLVRNTLKGQRRDEILAHFRARGIDPARVEARHAVEAGGGHFEVYRDIDVSLDVFPWCGHTTACESLWMGVPVVTLAGERHAGRMTASVLSTLGLSDWIAETPEQYLAIARRCAADLEGLARLRSGLRGRMLASPLCDGRSWTLGLEAAFRDIWRTWCAGEGSSQPPGG